MLALSRTRDTGVLLGQDILVTFRGLQGREALLEVSLPSGCSLRGPQGPVETQSSGEASVSRALVALNMEDRIQIGDEITVEFICLRGGCRARLGFEAPLHVAIMRYELTEAGQKEMPPATETQDDSGRNP